jgi:hypothetical protein
VNEFEEPFGSSRRAVNLIYICVIWYDENHSIRSTWPKFYGDTVTR